MASTVSLLRRLILESPPGEWAINQLRELLIGALKQGPVPQHVAFEMDGNRRYARTHRMETVEGHHRGFEALARIMEICYKCGVKVVTVYAFSIENFNRPKYEVEGLMQLAKVKLEQLTTYGDILDRYGACVRVLGQRDMIRDDVLQVVDKAVARTKHNNKAVLNICFPYTSRAEITTAIRETVQDFLTPPPPKNTPFSPSRIRQKVLSSQYDDRDTLPTIRDASPDNRAEGDAEKDVDGDTGDSSSTLLPDSPQPRVRARKSSTDSLPNPESITTDTLDSHMYTSLDPPLDVFVRTSGVERLSDFMLWQCHQDTHIFFLKCFWPDFDLQHFVWVLLEWQWRQKQKARDGSVQIKGNKRLHRLMRFPNRQQPRRSLPSRDAQLGFGSLSALSTAWPVGIDSTLARYRSGTLPQLLQDVTQRVPQYYQPYSKSILGTLPARCYQPIASVAAAPAAKFRERASHKPSSHSPISLAPTTPPPLSPAVAASSCEPWPRASSIQGHFFSTAHDYCPTGLVSHGTPRSVALFLVRLFSSLVSPHATNASATAIFTMKSAKPLTAEPSSHRRSQPVRQTRTNPPRSSLNAGRVGAREPPASRPVGDQPIEIFPAITHFADTMTALPKELVRHFTLLKEVDAKIFAPQEQLFKLVSAATQASLPSAQSQQDSASTAAPVSAPMSAQGSSTGGAQTNSLAPASTDEPSTAPGVFDPTNIPRRQLFRQTAFKIQEMLVSLEEKNHVISTANEALQHQLARVEDVWPYLENEFSDEAKWGSATHWAYPENRGGKSNFERARRDGAAAISAAAQALADEAAARSDARKQAVQAKKNMRNANHGAEMDGPREKKPSSKARKAEDGDNVGLGIFGTANGNTQKRRKTEKAAAGGTPMERSISSALGSTASKAKTSSPRATPAPEGAKKRRALPTGSAPPKKKPAISGKTPSTTSSPVVHNISEPKTGASPAPTSAPRPASSRARQNSVNSASETGKARRPSVTAKVTNGNTTDKPDAVSEKPTTVTDVPLPSKTEPGKKDSDKQDHTTTAAPPVPKKETRVEPPEIKTESTPSLPQPATVTTKSGRASKPSTPALATFQDAAAARASRARNDAKKSQRKGSTAHLVAQQAADDDATSSMQEEDEGDIDGDEPTYCYCNSVSYGEMVACDSDDCEREWFHLDCVGLKVAPGSKTKWYCEDCKERLRLAGKKISTR